MSRTYFSPDGQPSALYQYQNFTRSTPQPASSHDSGQPSGASEGYGLVYPDGPSSSVDASSQYHAGGLPEGTTFEARLRGLMRQQGDELWTFADCEGRNVDEVSQHHG
jgi:hypothetical protein